MKPMKKPKMHNGKVAPPKKSKKVQQAEEAVAQFEDMKQLLFSKREKFEATFPKANAALQDIKGLEDEIQEQINACKLLVREAGQSIGEFTYTPKTTREGYIGKLLLELLDSLPPEDGHHLFQELYQRGVISDLRVDADASRVIHKSDPHLRKQLESAWDPGGKPMTPAVTTPKL